MPWIVYDWFKRCFVATVLNWPSIIWVSSMGQILINLLVKVYPTDIWQSYDIWYTRIYWICMYVFRLKFADVFSAYEHIDVRFDIYIPSTTLTMFTCSAYWSTFQIHICGAWAHQPIDTATQVPPELCALRGGGFETGRRQGTQWERCGFLVGGIPTPLNNMSSSVGMMTFPIYGKS